MALTAVFESTGHTLLLLLQLLSGFKVWGSGLLLLYLLCCCSCTAVLLLFQMNEELRASFVTKAKAATEEVRLSLDTQAHALQSFLCI